MRSLLWLISVLCLAASAANALAVDATQPLGRYNFVLGKGGSSDIGVGTFTVNAQGAVRGLVRLSNGAALSGGGTLGEDGAWAVKMNGQNGLSLTGKIAFGGSANRCSGALVAKGLLVPGRPIAGVYPPPTAVTQTLKLTGSRYAGAAKFPATKPHGTMAVQIKWGPGNHVWNVYSMRLAPSGVFVPAASGARPLTLRFDPKTGLVRGSLDDGTWVMHGAMLSQEKAMRGFIGDSGGWTFTVKAGRAVATQVSGSGSSSSGSSSVTMSSGSVRVMLETSGGTLTLAEVGTLTITNPDAMSVTNEAGQSIVLTSVADGDFVLFHGRRYRVNRTADSNAVTLISSPLSGTTSSGGVGAAGAGTLILSGSNTYTGGAVTVSGGTLQLTSGATLTFDRSSAQLNTVTLGTSGAILVNSAGSLTHGATSTNLTSGLVKTGSGTLTLSGSNTYTGSTTLTAGTLQMRTTGLSVSSTLSVLNFSQSVIVLGGDTAGFAENHAAVIGSGTLTLSSGVASSWSQRDPAAATLSLNYSATALRNAVRASEINARLPQPEGVSLTVDPASP